MVTATAKDILSVFPDLTDHALVEIRDLEVTIDDLEAALAALASEDVDMLEIRQREGDRINLLLDVLRQAGIEVSLSQER